MMNGESTLQARPAKALALDSGVDFLEESPRKKTLMMISITYLISWKQ
jgi:hypothetical protein